MKYVRQICVIFLFSFLGELCAAMIPFQLPAAIYGMILLVLALLLKLVKFEWVKEAGAFLTGLLPLLFIVPVVGLMDHWDSVASSVWAIGAIIVVTSVAVFAVTGIVTQKIMEKRDNHD